MNSFFLRWHLLGLACIVFCSHIHEQNSGNSSDDDTLMLAFPSTFVLMTKNITCDPGLIKLRTWDFDQTADISAAFSCLTHCIEKDAFDGIVAMMEVATPKARQLLFEHTVCEALAQKNSALVINLLTFFDAYPLPLAAFIKVRTSGCKGTLPSLMGGWKYRYPGVSALDIMDEIVTSCVYFNEHALLYVFLSICPFVSAGTIRAFEDSVLNSNIPIGMAILRSGVLGADRTYARMNGKTVEFRRSMRAQVTKLIVKGALAHAHELIDDIEIPFIIQMMAKSVYQPRSFIYLINRFGSSLLKSEALSIFKAACISADPDVFQHALKVICGLKYDLPLIYQAFLSGSRLGPVQIIDSAISTKYVLQPMEVISCVELMINNSQAVSLLLKTWPQHLCISEVFALFPELIKTGNKATILAAIKLCVKSHLFTYHRYVAYCLMGETNHRGLALQQQKHIQEDPEMLYAVLRTIDPKFFGQQGRPYIHYYASNPDKQIVQKFLRNSSKILLGRINRCMNHLSKINVDMRSKQEPKCMLIKMFIRDGGSWEELALLAVQNPGQENLLQQAMGQDSIDPFIVDPLTKLGLLDWPGLSEESRDIIWKAQMRAVGRSKKLRLLWQVLSEKDAFLIIADRYRQIAIDSHRKVFNHNS